jgi:hypothetical protein
MEGFEFDIRYMPGGHFNLADFLSLTVVDREKAHKQEGHTALLWRP